MSENVPTQDTTTSGAPSTTEESPAMEIDMLIEDECQLDKSDVTEILKGISGKLTDEQAMETKRIRYQSQDDEGSRYTIQIENKKTEISSTAEMDRPEDIREYTVRIMKHSATPVTTEPKPGTSSSTGTAQHHSASSKSASLGQSTSTVAPNPHTDEHLFNNCYVISSAPGTYFIAHRIEEDEERDQYCFEFLEQHLYKKEVFYIPPNVQRGWFFGSDQMCKVEPEGCGEAADIGFYLTLPENTLHAYGFFET